jgi:hypothetical protein
VPPYLLVRLIMARQSAAALPSADPREGRRQALLDPAFADVYPEIPAGIWVTAVSASFAILGGVMAGARSWPYDGPRVLSDRHFIFRGAEVLAGEPTRVTRRVTDP